MEHAQLCIIPGPIRKGNRLMPNLFQRIFWNANVWICSMLDGASRRLVYITDFAKDHARLGLVPILGRRRTGCQWWMSRRKSPFRTRRHLGLELQRLVRICFAIMIPRHTKDQTWAVKVLCMVHPSYEDEDRWIESHHRKVKDPGIVKIKWFALFYARGLRRLMGFGTLERWFLVAIQKILVLAVIIGINHFCKQTGIDCRVYLSYQRRT